MKPPSIHMTDKYGQFNMIKVNRGISPALVKRLKQSISTNNLLHVNPIIVNKNMDIIDGQHRLMAARDLGVSIYYVILEKDDISDIPLLNANMSAWKLPDYAQFYVEQGNEAYSTILKFMERYEVGTTMALIQLIGTQKDRGVGFLRNRFRAGEIEPGDLDMDRGQGIARQIERLKPLMHGALWRSTPFVNALLNASREVGLEALVDKLVDHGQPILMEATTLRYYQRFEEAYNHGLHKKNQVRLY